MGVSVTLTTVSESQWRTVYVGSRPYGVGMLVAGYDVSVCVCVCVCVCGVRMRCVVCTCGVCSVYVWCV